MMPIRMRVFVAAAAALAIVSTVSISMTGPMSPMSVAAQTPASSLSGPVADWPLHNLDLAGSRYSPLHQIDRSNVKSLVPRWLFQHGVIDGVSNKTTPLIVNGTMYVTDSRGSMHAVDAADGRRHGTPHVTAEPGGST